MQAAPLIAPYAQGQSRPFGAYKVLNDTHSVLRRLLARSFQEAAFIHSTALRKFYAIQIPKPTLAWLKREIVSLLTPAVTTGKGMTKATKGKGGLLSMFRRAGTEILKIKLANGKFGIFTSEPGRWNPAHRTRQELLELV